LCGMALAHVAATFDVSYSYMARTTGEWSFQAVFLIC